MRDAYGAALVRYGEADTEFVVIDADNAPATRTAAFAKRFPERFFNVGCAEQNMAGIAAGIALTGLPVVASTFAIFLAGRAYEQIRNTICMGGLPVTLVGTHAGVTVGYDGASHFCVEDLALMRAIPAMQVFVASSNGQVEPLLSRAIQSRRPAYLRISRQDMPGDYQVGPVDDVGASIVRPGRDATIVACGLMVNQAMHAARLLAAAGVDVEVIDTYSVKPLADGLITGSAERTGAVVVAEEHSPHGGLGEAVAGVLARGGHTPMVHLALPDAFASSGNPAEMLDRYGLSVDNLVAAVRQALAGSRSRTGRD
jgi:transketolase